MNIALLILAAFLFLSIYLGIRARKGKEMSLEQWAVGGRGFGTLFVFLLMAGENFTTYTFLGGSGGAYGLGGPMIYVFSALCYIVSYWLLPPVWKYAKKHNVLTQSDFFVSKYNSTKLGVLTATVGIISIIPYLVLQFKGLGIIVSESSYGTVSQAAAIWIGAVSVALFVTVSGIHGSAWTSIVKDIIMLVVILFMAIYLPYHYYGGFKPMFQQIDAAKPGFLLLPEAGLSISWYVSTSILFALGLFMWPHMFGASLSSKSAQVLRRNAAMTPLYQIVLVFVLFIGFAAVLQVPGLESQDLALFKLAKMTFDPWFVGIIGAAGLLTALVPSSMLLMTAAALLAKNIYKVLKPDTTDKQISRISRFTVPIIALLALYFTFAGGEMIIMLLIMAYGFVAQLFPALFFSLWKKNPITVQGAFTGIFVGVSTVAYVTLTGTTMATLFPTLPQAIKDLDKGIIALFINITVMFTVSVITRKKSVLREQSGSVKISS
ncbi:sodium:solute symporter [Peribacillus butanolivorans]|uniref:sodium:solute symporter family protein n=1 Tax=Peribacillus butanolivorans TaxID=421767 RepID=UPI00207CA879|nr:sodium:solute symporter [Peribacillus butanolivorans]MCO0598468.1 sodium:solute symporter [Peribacillus butanolivorans]